MGPYLADITALVSLPFTFFMSNDAFYFGVLPILSEAAQGYGISAVEMARASLIGQPVHLLSPLVPSTYLLVGLAGVEFGDHQRYALAGHDDLPGDAGGCAGVRLCFPGRQRRLSRRAPEIEFPWLCALLTSPAAWAIPAPPSARRCIAPATAWGRLRAEIVPQGSLAEGAEGAGL